MEVLQKYIVGNEENAPTTSNVVSNNNSNSIPIQNNNNKEENYNGYRKLDVFNTSDIEGSKSSQPSGLK